MSDSSCPCGSGRPLADCCGPYLAEHALAPTAEALMRSRYSAFALGNRDYLLATWHPSTRPAFLDRSGPRWLGLEVQAVAQGTADDTAGQVTFTARYQADGRIGELRERSRFVREGGRWFYLDGDPAEPAAVRIGRNDPCPCGSGRKYKRCCG